MNEHRWFIVQELNERLERMVKYFPDRGLQDLYRDARREAAEYAAILTGLDV